MTECVPMTECVSMTECVLMTDQNNPEHADDQNNPECVMMCNPRKNTKRLPSRERRDNRPKRQDELPGAPVPSRHDDVPNRETPSTHPSAYNPTTIANTPRHVSRPRLALSLSHLILRPVVAPATSPSRRRYRQSLPLELHRRKLTRAIFSDPTRKDPKYKRFSASIDRALALFDSNNLQEWADYISFLARLLKVSGCCRVLPSGADSE